MRLFQRNAFAFDNYGGAYQLRLNSGDALEALLDLDEPFWIATSAPKEQLRVAPTFLARLDRDNSGRVHSSEIRDTALWLLRVVRDRTGITEARAWLDLDALNMDDPDGKRLHETARRVLENLGMSGSQRLELSQVRNHEAIFAEGADNGDGVIPPAAAAEFEVRELIEAVMGAVGSVKDASGADGVDGTLLTRFIDDAQALLAWRRRCDGEELLPFGEETAARFSLFSALRPKIEAYFQYCRVAAMNALLGCPPPAHACPGDVWGDPEAAAAYLREAPLAAPSADPVLSLERGLNPVYRDRITVLARDVLAPLLGRDFDGQGLSEAQWQAVTARFAPYEQWNASKRGAEVEKIGIERLERFLAGDAVAALRDLMRHDLEAGKELAALQDLEYLLLAQGCFLELCNNFVSFPALYNPNRAAMFEAGRMVMDGRIFHFNFRIGNVEQHSASAVRSGIYLLYCEVTGTKPEETFYVVTPVTRGPMGNLGLDKRGVLFDRDGRQWDVRVVRVVDNPVNFREAIAAPFRRLAALASSAAERISATADQQMEGRVMQSSTVMETRFSEGIATAGPPATAPSAPPAAGASPNKMRDLALVGGVTIAALGSSFAYITSTFAEMNPMVILYGLGIIILLVLIPTAVVAVMKLRRQDLSAILEASGWAINARMRLGGHLRRLIVERPVHPKRFRLHRADITRRFSRSREFE